MRAVAICVLWAASHATALGADPTAAANYKDFPSCRELLFHESRPKVAPRDYFILVDRTVVLADTVADQTVDRVIRAIQPGDHVEIVSFSGLTATEVTLVELDERLDVLATEREYETKLPASDVDSARLCFSRQLDLGRNHVRQVLGSNLHEPDRDARHSEILNALTAISRQTITASEARDRVVVVISDMLENSDFTSFYSHRTLRKIQPDAVLAAAQAKQFVGDFKRARVYVIGAATISEPGAARGLLERQALREFWQHWFELSHGTMVGWAETALQDIH